ncbi:54S ribosomal protein L12, mitochondrial [Rhizina undulata]
MSLATRTIFRAAAASANRRVVPTTAAVVVGRRCNSTAAAAPNPKISSIVDQISTLTLLETADLVSLLKTRLNIPDLALQSFSAAPAAAPTAAVEEAPAEEAVQEKTMFNVKLQSFEASAKPKIIKEVKSMLGLSLVDSKKFVEAAPKILKEGLAKEEAEKIQKVLKDLGAEVTLE